MINTPNSNPTRETLQENHWSRVKLWSETKIFLKKKIPIIQEIFPKNLPFSLFSHIFFLTDSPVMLDEYQ